MRIRFEPELSEEALQRKEALPRPAVVAGLNRFSFFSSSTLYPWPSPGNGTRTCRCHDIHLLPFDKILFSLTFTNIQEFIAFQAPRLCGRGYDMSFY